MHTSRPFLYLTALAALLMWGSACVVETDHKQADAFVCQSNDDCTSGFVCINGVCDRERPMLLCDDQDMDGFFAGEQCTQPQEELDCDDTNNSVNPGAPEQCNNADDNCNGEIDENIAADQLGCPLTVGVCASVSAMRTCQDGVLVPEDCQENCPGPDCLYGEDFVPVEGGVGGEGCGDNLDNDCNGTKDEEDGCASCTVGAPCGSACVELPGEPAVPDEQCPCNIGEQQCTAEGTPDFCRDPETNMPTIRPFTQNEVCGNMLDDDCNGRIDDGC